MRLNTNITHYLAASKKRHKNQELPRDNLRHRRLDGAPEPTRLK